MLNALSPRSKQKRPAAETIQRLERLGRITDFIRDYQARHYGQAPTCREIAQGTDIPSTSIVARYLRALHKQGILVRVRTHYCLPRVIDWYSQERHASVEGSPQPGTDRRQ